MASCRPQDEGHRLIERQREIPWRGSPARTSARKLACHGGFTRPSSAAPSRGPPANATSAPPRRAGALPRPVESTLAEGCPFRRSPWATCAAYGVCLRCAYNNVPCCRPPEQGRPPATIPNTPGRYPCCHGASQHLVAAGGSWAISPRAPGSARTQFTSSSRLPAGNRGGSEFWLGDAAVQPERSPRVPGTQPTRRGSHRPPPA